MLSVVFAMVMAFQSPADVAKAEKVLAEKPDDPAANLVIGKSNLSAGEAKKAMPFLMKVSDASLKTAAKADSEAEEKKALDWVEVGDLWTKAMAKNAPMRQACLDRASFWYDKAWPDLDTLLKQKLRERLTKLYAPVAPGPIRKPPVAGWPGPGTDKIDSTRVHSGSYALHYVVSKKPGLAEVGGGESFELPKKGGELEFSVWILTDKTDSLDETMIFRAYDASGKEAAIIQVPFSKDTPIWSRKYYKIPYPEGAVKGRVQFFLAGAQGEIWYDDISIKVDGKELLKNGGFEEK